MKIGIGLSQRRWSSLRLVRWLVAFAVLGLLALLVWDLIGTSSGAQFAKRADANRKPAAPSFQLPAIWRHAETWPPSLRPALGDGSTTLAELYGNVVVINFWASWCYSCKQEAPALRRVASRYRGEVAVVGIDVQDLPSSARAFLSRFKVNYPSLRDGTDRTYAAYGLTGLPETYVIDRQGRTLQHIVGQAKEEDLRRFIEPLRGRRQP